MKRMACWAGILASLGLTAAATTFDFVVETTKADRDISSALPQARR